MQARSMVFRQANVPSLEEVTLPPMGPGDAVVKIHFSGISAGTESSIINGSRTHNGTFPLVSGYMASGIVEAVGEEVSDLKVGERVVSSSTRIEGLNAVWGGHTSRHVSSAASLTRLPANVDLRDAAMWILPRVGLHGTDVAGVSARDVVLISGQGLIGQFFSQWARVKGARVVALEPCARRAALARELVGATVLNPCEEGLEEKVLEACGGIWPTICVEATGNKNLIEQTTRFLRRDGAKMVFLSWYPGRIELDFSCFHHHGATAYFPMGDGSQATGQRVLEGLADGQIRIGEALTETYVWQQADAVFRRVAEGDRELIGAVIDWRTCE